MFKMKIKNILIVAGIIVAVGLILMLIGNKMEANAIKANQGVQNYTDWLSENCNCMEHNRPHCPDGFNLSGMICFDQKNKIYTGRILGCSEYNCSGKIKTFNNITQTWEN